MSVRAGLALFPRLMAFLDARNEALLASDIGLGEYLYIYTLAYPVWLGTPVDDGPSSLDIRGGGLEVRSEPGGRQRRLEELREQLNGLLLPMLRSQLEDLRDTAAGPAGWRQALEAEIEQMQRDAQRLPWQDGLPAQTAASLEPFRDRLESSYSPLSHPFELVPLDADRSGG